MCTRTKLLLIRNIKPGTPQKGKNIILIYPHISSYACLIAIANLPTDRNQQVTYQRFQYFNTLLLQYINRKPKIYRVYYS